MLDDRSSLKQFFTRIIEHLHEKLCTNQEEKSAFEKNEGNICQNIINTSLIAKRGGKKIDGNKNHSAPTPPPTFFSTRVCIHSMKTNKWNKFLLVKSLNPFSFTFCLKKVHYSWHRITFPISAKLNLFSHIIITMHAWVTLIRKKCCNLPPPFFNDWPNKT